MVCTRCKMTVEAELKHQGFHPKSVALGEVEIEEELTDIQRKALDDALAQYGFSLINDRKGRIVERVKTLIVELIQESNSDLKQNLSTYLSDKFNLDYTYLSSLYTQIEGSTIEQFYITQRIEKVKELLVYDELSLSEIADRLNYSSVAYLSSQFRRVVGLTPSHFKKVKSDKRIPIDQLGKS